MSLGIKFEDTLKFIDKLVGINLTLFFLSKFRISF